MTPIFFPASELKKKYLVFGHFYNVDLGPDESLSCRSVLEIFTRTGAADIDEARRQLPDAIFVMMNPGSSRPLREMPIPTLQRQQESLLRKSLVPTKPDTTQYQVMRVMSHLSWEHVRVINLSDLREAKSATFVGKYRAIEKDHGFTSHSIFASSRVQELNSELLRKPAAPLVCAWGVSSTLDPLLKVAFPKLLAMGDCRGVLKAGTSDKYFHPLPTLQSAKETWLTDACKYLSVAFQDAAALA